jgi:hypothetical protein
MTPAATLTPTQAALPPGRQAVAPLWLHPAPPDPALPPLPPSQECWTEECVEAHTNVDVIVDLEALKALLDSRVPLVLSGASVKDAELPWPLSGVEQVQEAAAESQ